MKALRILICLLFVGTCFAYYMIMKDIRSKTDNTLPVITCDDDILNVKIDDEKALLTGITAYDKKDGDISENIIIENISKFVEKGVCNITYVVSDNDNHVVKYIRKIKYNDYYSPRFYLNGELSFNVGQNIRIQDYVRAYDCLDGEISEKVKYTSGYVDTQIPGVYHMNAQVSNSKGDVSYIEFDVNIKERSSKDPLIELKNYLIYITKGTVIDEKEYIKSVLKYDGITAIDISMVQITSNLDTDKKGIYTITYHVEDGIYNDESTLICIVEDYEQGN